MDLKEILGDLLTLEVNTIIKDGMTANKMPALPFALHDILAAYCGRMRGFGLNLEPYFEVDRERLWSTLDQKAQEGEPRAKKLVDEAERAYRKLRGHAPGARIELYHYLTDLWPVLERSELPGPTEQRFVMDEVDNGWDSFERIRIAANQALDFHAASAAEGVRQLDTADRMVLMRIVGNCSRLKFVVQGIQRNHEHWSELIPMTRNQLLMGDMHGKGVPLDKLGTAHQATVRKIWELGTEQIAAQTCVQIDGDVLTRLSPAVIEQHNEVVRSLIMKAHHESIGTSLSYWKMMIEVVQRLGNRVLRR